MQYCKSESYILVMGLPQGLVQYQTQILAKPGERTREVVLTLASSLCQPVASAMGIYNDIYIYYIHLHQNTLARITRVDPGIKRFRLAGFQGHVPDFI